MIQNTKTQRIENKVDKMKYKLKNNELEVEIESRGAELQSIKDRNGVNYLWDGNPDFWVRRAPILFPFIGRLKNNSYFYKGKEYQSGPHGFARDMDFTLIASTDSELWFELCDTDETYEIYPFRFSLKIGYELCGKKLQVKWRVENRDDREEMYFSIGAHPGFFCPLRGKEAEKEGYFLELKGGENTLFYQFAHADTGLLLSEKKEMQLENNRIRITKEFFDESTYLFLNNQLSEVSLVKPSGEIYISLQFDMPILALWSPEKKNAPFICIEPWYGCCDSEEFEGSLEEREWGNCLKPLEVFENSYSISIQ